MTPTLDNQGKRRTPNGSNSRLTVFLDRDGVLNRNVGTNLYVRSWNEWEWLPGAKDALRLFKSAGYAVVVITNQSGIAQGKMSEKDLSDIHQRMCADALESGGRIDAIYHCPHGRDEGCECRKPSPGMLLQAQKDMNLNLSDTRFIGDDDRDRLAAEAAGCPCSMVTEDISLLDIAQRLLSGDLA